MGIGAINGLNLIRTIITQGGKPTPTEQPQDQPVTIYISNSTPALLTEQGEIDYYLNLLSTGDETAISALTDIYLATKSTDSLFNLALILYAQGRYQLAKVILEKVQEKLEQEKESDERNLKLARTYEYLGLYDKAIKLYNQIITLSPDKPGSFYAKLNLASLYTSLLMYEQALDICKKMDLTDVAVVSIQYRCLIGLNKSKEAAALLNQTLKLIQLQQKNHSDPNKILAYAELLLASGNYKQAEAILSPLLETQDIGITSGALSLLSQIYYITNNSRKLEGLLQICQANGLYLDYLNTQHQLATLALTNISQNNPEAPEAIEAQSNIVDSLAQQLKGYLAQKHSIFPNAATAYELYSFQLFCCSYVTDADLKDFEAKIPGFARRLKQAVEQYRFIKAMHQAASAKKPMPFEKYQIEYIEYTPWLNFSSATTSDSFLHNLLSINSNTSIPNYFTLAPGKLLALLQKNSSVPLKNLSVSEAIDLAAGLAQQIVLQYGEQGTADITNTSLEDKIKKGAFNKAVCRHYTAIFITLFNLLKEQNPNLNGFFVFADLAPLHTFPTICTIQGNKVYFASIDPTADDSTPEVFGDKLAAEPNVHFQFDEYIQELIENKDYKKAITIIKTNIKDSPLNENLISLYFRLYSLLELCGAGKEKYEELFDQLGQTTSSLPAGDSKQNFLRLLAAKCLVKFNAYQAAIEFLQHVQGLANEAIIDYNTTMLEAYLGLDDQNILTQAIQYAAQSENLGVYAKIENGFVQSPIIPYLEDGTKVIIKIDDNHVYEAVVLGGKLALPSDIPFSEQSLENYRAAININPASQTRLP